MNMNSDYEYLSLKVQKELKDKPELIHNTDYISKNLSYIDKSFSEYPEEFQNNSLFVFHYFTQKISTKKEYKYITPELLDNPFFISSVLVKNPDIYLLVDDKYHTESLFNILNKYHKEHILKYANMEQLDDLNFCRTHIKAEPNNYKYASETVRGNIDICRIILKEDFHHKLIKYLPEIRKNDKEFINYLPLNSYSFAYLPKEYKEDMAFCLKMSLLDSKSLKYVYPSLKEEKTFWDAILNDYQYKKNHSQYSTDFDIADVFRELPIDYFDTSFCHLYQKEIHFKFGKLSSIQRANQLVIQTAFDYFKIKDLDIYESLDLHYVNYIDDIELKEALKSYLKGTRFMTDKKELHVHAIPYLNTYYLQKNLHENLHTNEQKSKKLKI